MVAFGLQVHTGFLNGFNFFSELRVTASLKTPAFPVSLPKNHLCSEKQVSLQQAVYFQGCPHERFWPARGEPPVCARLGRHMVTRLQCRVHFLCCPWLLVAGSQGPAWLEGGLTRTRSKHRAAVGWKGEPWALSPPGLQRGGP